MKKNIKQNRQQKKEKKKPCLRKKMRFVFFFQTSNLYLIKQKYKSFLKLFSLQNILEKRKYKQNK
jgi:hypothetical protein